MLIYLISYAMQYLWKNVVIANCKSSYVLPVFSKTRCTSCLQIISHTRKPNVLNAHQWDRLAICFYSCSLWKRFACVCAFCQTRNELVEQNVLMFWIWSYSSYCKVASPCIYLGKQTTLAVHFAPSADQWGVFQRPHLSRITCCYLRKASVSFHTGRLTLVVHYNSSIFTVAQHACTEESVSYK
jgi:hypothetical protein